jgi:homoserine dehydrogenase
MTLRIVQLGFGGVGQALVDLYLDLAPRYPWLSYAGIADRSGLCLMLPDGWPVDELKAALDAKRRGETLAQFARGREGRAWFVPAQPSRPPGLAALMPGGDVRARDVVVADVTADRDAYGTLFLARQWGAHIVMCNKWALAEPVERYDGLLAAGNGELRYETTVGAALPVISTLDRLLESGDDVLRIEAAISGTLGFVCSEIQGGVPFSVALADAQARGYTEPDPRDDLAGIDARRKALILARKLGKRINMDDVRVESLVPPGLESVSLDEFWRRLPEADPHYAARVTEAATRGSVLRFLARIDETGASVALAETPLNSLAGSLTGTESLFVFHTRRYGDQPLAVRGRGAGAALTASGVLSDILGIGEQQAGTML